MSFHLAIATQPIPIRGNREAMDDRDAIEAARRGDQDAFAVLVTRYQDQLFTMALRLLGSPTDASDVVQDTFTRAFTHLNDLRSETVRAWLFRVATNCARDLQRKRVRRPEAPLENDEGKVIEMPDPALGPEHDAIAHESAATIRHALQQLPDESREVIVLRDVNDLSYPEIAAALRIPLGTVKSRISRARGQLVEILKNSPGFFAELSEGKQ
jgi:RNA polymerase sigma-70 factor (ECF subfamily)